MMLLPIYRSAVRQFDSRVRAVRPEQWESSTPDTDWDVRRLVRHVIASQSHMTFPLGEYLINKMRHYYHFESNPLAPERAHIALPTGPGFNVQLDPGRIESQVTLKGE